MGNSFKTFFNVTATIVGIVVAVFLILQYWERILAYLQAGQRVATNVLNQYMDGSKPKSQGPSDYYDI